ncbi:unnamed protein product, partial [marine sediment metagenome]
MSNQPIDETLEKWQEKVKEEVPLPDTVSAVLDQAIGMISAGDEEAGKFQEQLEVLIPNLPDEDKKRMTRFLLDFNYIQGLGRRLRGKVEYHCCEGLPRECLFGFLVQCLA